MTETLKLRTLALAIVTGCAMLASQNLWAEAAAAADAQEEADDSSTDESTAGEPEELDTVTVTGSRIKRAGYDTLEPAITVSREYVERRGLTNIADALNEIPGFGTGVTPEGGQASFGAGVNFVNRFGLGSNRTLTLVNGRRFVSSNPVTIFGPAAPGLQVDLNAIPTQLIERVDNLTVGGAPTYGADAIAGTVNLILREDYEGFEIGSTFGLTDRGDNHRYNARALWGTNFGDDRGNIVVSAVYDSVDGLNQTDREIFNRALLFGVNPLANSLTLQPGRTPQNDGRANPNIPFNTSSADGIPNAVLIFGRRLSQLTPGGLIFPATGGTTLTNGGGLPRGFGPGERTLIQFDNNGNIVPYNPGIPFGNTDAVGGDGYNLVESLPLFADLERKNLFSQGHFDFTDDVRGYFELLYFSSDAFEINDQPIFNATQFGGNSAPLTFSVNDPRLTAQARARLQELGVTSFRISRASRDLVTNNSRTETDLYRGVAGVTWDFEAFDRSFSWDTSITYGRSEADNFQTVLNQQNFINAINVTTNAAGQIVCNPTGTIGVITGGFRPNGDANCTPIDIFGEGRTSAAGRAYVTGVTNAESILKQTVFNTNLGGDFLDYWAGSIGFNLGFEYRKEEGQFSPDAFQQAGLGRAVPIAPNGGDFHTEEFFAEFSVPLVSPDNEIWGVHSLTTDLKGRRVDNTVNGSFDSYTFGVQWRPIEDLNIRGNRTRSLRAPSITELFTPISSAFFFVNDPCDSRFINTPSRPGGPTGPGTPRFENCQALFRSLGLAPANGTVTNFQSNIVGASQQGVTGGDPGLRNEDADASTIGFVWEPGFLPGLSLAVDYIEIDIRDAIVQLTATQIANACYDDPNFDRANPANGNAFCSRLNRDAAGQIVNSGTRPAVSTGFANVATTDFRGLTAELRYAYEFENGLVTNFGISAFNLRELSTELLGTRDFADDEIGNSPRQYQFSAGFLYGKWNVNVQNNYLSSASFDRTFTVETRDILRVDSYDTWDLGVNYQVNDDGVVRLSVSNVLDDEPPYGVLGIGTYDVIGRRYAVSTEWRW